MPRLGLDSPVGPLSLVEENEALVAVDWHGRSSGAPTLLLLEARRQLLAYFARELQEFSLPLAPRGTPDELRVWEQMAAIPYGQTRRYGDLGRALGMDARDVGQFCGRNRLPILIPCHRVVGSDGTMVGYSGGAGIETKLSLLRLEGALLL